MGRLNNKTAQRLKLAFWDIFENKDINDIRIEEIVVAAGYSRSLFYTYFKDIYDLYERIESDTLEKFKEILTHFRNFFKSGKITKEDEDAFLEKIVPLYKSIERILKTLFLRQDNERFRFRIAKILKQHFLENLELHQYSQPEIFDLYIEGLVASHISTLSHSYTTYGRVDLKQCLSLAKMIYFQNPHSILQQIRKN